MHSLLLLKYFLRLKFILKGIKDQAQKAIECAVVLQAGLGHVNLKLN